MGAIEVQFRATNPTPLRSRYHDIRGRTLALAAPLSAEDQQIQSMPDVSPTKWHLAHVTWFFETFLLTPHLAGYEPFDANFGYLFNSYYETVGERQPRPERGLLSRPSLDEVLAYRRHVDEAMDRLLTGERDTLAPLVELGLNHEQQHQELLMMDIKHVFSVSPLRPAYASPQLAPQNATRAMAWTMFDGGLVEIGTGGDGFAFDNEGPRHKVWLEPYQIADRLITEGEWLAFIEDEGYRRPELWLSDGWATVEAQGWNAPLYWRRVDDTWRVHTLSGERDLQAAAPVCHVSGYEADAYARWTGRRLPSEAEWEHAARDVAPRYETAHHPRPAAAGEQMFGEVWQWTASAYAPYPRYKPLAGALGEYNGKFMSNQLVLRGSACITPQDHARPTYRNFFPPAARWCFGGLRLADDA